MKPSIEKKLQTLVERHEELSALLSDPDVINQQAQYRDYSKEYAQLTPLVAAFKNYRTCLMNKEGAEQLLKEPDLEIQQLAKQELKDAEIQLQQLEQQLQILLLPRDLTMIIIFF